MLTRVITKYQFLNIKLISARALAIAVWVLIGSHYFLVETVLAYLLISFTFLLSLILGIFLIHSVETEIKNKKELQVMSDKLAISNSQLIKLDNAKSEFISIASHQLRTPLTAIKGFVSLLLEGTYGTIEPKIRDALNKIYLSNERMVELVENLLNISRIESGRMEYKFKKVKVEGILKELYDTFYITSKNKGLELVVDLPRESLPKVEIDSVKSKEVISNLIDNALKYTSEGRVLVKARLVPEKEFVRVSVVDTGVGIPAEEMPYLFNKFSRGQENKNRLHATGTGLGLYIGKQMIEAQNGRLWVESEGKGKGSVFNVDLPISQEKYRRTERIKNFLKGI